VFSALTSEGAPEYRPKPPLWRPKFEARTPLAAILASGAFLLLVVVGLAFLPDGSFLNVPVGQVEARVVRVVGGAPADEAPASFRHVVSMPDGSEGLFVAEHLYRPGDRLLVTVTRGRLTGRMTLRPPYRVLPKQGSTHADPQEPQ
jgi:hypothetical protein